MANNLGALTVSLGLDAAQYMEGLSKAEVQAKKFAGAVGNAIESLRSGFIVAGAAAAGLALAINQQADNIAKFQDLADKVGDTAEAIASLKAASDVSGVALDSVAAASVKLTTALSKTDEDGQGAAQAIKALGLNFGEFSKLSPVEQIDAVARAFAQFEDGASKTAVAVALFGKSGAELIPFLNDLADGAERSNILTAEQIALADEYTKQVARLKAELSNTAMVIGANTVPAMSSMVEQATLLVKYFKETSNETSLLAVAMRGVQTIFETLIIVGANVAYVFRQTGNEIGGIAAQLAALATGDIQGFKAISEAMKADAARARAELDKFEQQVLSRKVVTPTAAADTPTRKSLSFTQVKDPSAKSTATDKAQQFIESLEKQIIATQDLSRQEEALQEIQSGRLGKVTEKQREQILNAAGMIDYLAAEKRFNEELAKAEEARADASLEYQEKYRQWLEKVKANTETGRLEAQREEMLKLTEALDKRDLTEQQYLEATTELLKLKGEELQKTKSFSEELGLTFSSAFEQAILQGKKFSDVLKGIAQDIVAMMVRRSVTKPLADAIGGFDWSSIFSGGKAIGGDVMGGRSYLVGERGPELFTPAGNGSISTPGTNINQTITIDARGADAGVEMRILQAMRQTKAETLAEVQARANRGGSFARAVGRA